jgi:MFS family permease
VRRPRPPLFFPGWLVVAGAFTVMMVGYGAAYSSAAFAFDFEAAFGLSRASVSGIYGLCGFTTFTVGAISGLLADRLGPRLLSTVGMLLVALGLLIPSLSDHNL